MATRSAASRRPKVETTNSVEKRRLLVARAAELFDEVGYHNASVEDVAEACGIRKPTLYHYFKSKDEILYSIHDEFIDLVIARQQARESLELSPAQELLEIMGDVLDLMATHRGYVRVFFEHYRELGEEQAAAIKVKRDTYEASIRAVFARGVESGEFRGVKVELSTLALAGMCNWAYHWFDPDGPLTSREVAYVFWDILTRGIRPEATA
jgi:AcrR family transcriptional regulator